MPKYKFYLSSGITFTHSFDEETEIISLMRKAKHRNVFFTMQHPNGSRHINIDHIIVIEETSDEKP